MMFILDAIQCAAEEATMFVEEKAARWDEERTIKRMSRREAEEELDEENPEKNPTEEDEATNECFDSFNEYLRECAMGVLSPFGTQKDAFVQEDEEHSEGTDGALAEKTQEELKTVIQSFIAKLSDEDKKEVMESLKSKNMSADINGLIGIPDES